jgi:hypothetical protein
MNNFWLFVDVVLSYVCINVLCFCYYVFYDEHIGLDWCLLFLVEGEAGGFIIMHVNILVLFCYYFVCMSFMLLAGSNLKTDQSNPAKPTRGIQWVMTRTHP